jgi:quercetin dioxygenase-like cupin family protein
VSSIDPSRILSVEAGAVPFKSTTIQLWGDPDAGQVNDWIYVSSDKLYQIVFSLPPGKVFRHSERNRTIFGADEFYYVLSGAMLLANPETGEVLRAEKGEAAYFGPDTWHHAFSQGPDELRVLEFFAPPPAAGASQTYARTKPYLSENAYTQDQWLGQWPEAAAEARSTATFNHVRREDVLWRIEGAEPQIAIGILLSTAQLTVGLAELLPGQSSGPRVHGGDLSVYVLDGRLNVLVQQDGIPSGRWFQMDPADGFYAPAGIPHEYFNMSDRVVRFIFGVAPSYLPTASPSGGESTSVASDSTSSPDDG